MEVILLEKIHKLGDLGDRVKVKPGYGRNYLIPTGKAVFASAVNIAKFDERRAELEKQQKEILDAASYRAEKLNEICISIACKAGSEGKLFGSVSAIDIAKAVTATGIELAKNEIKLPEGPIRSTGDYELSVELHGTASATIRVTVVAEEDS